MGAERQQRLERFALLKSRPVNRDTLRAVKYKRDNKSKAKRQRRNLKPSLLQRKRTDREPRIRLVSAEDEAARKAKLSRLFGLRKVRPEARHAARRGKTIGSETHMTTIRYAVVLAPQPHGGFTVTFPDIPEAITEGDTREAALFAAAEALTLALEQRIADNEALPAATHPKGSTWVEPTSRVH